VTSRARWSRGLLSATLAFPWTASGASTAAGRPP
jgi:hypothetical protein